MDIGISMTQIMKVHDRLAVNSSYLLPFIDAEDTVSIIAILLNAMQLSRITPAFCQILLYSTMTIDIPCHPHINGQSTSLINYKNMPAWYQYTPWSIKKRATLFLTITPMFHGGFLHLLYQWKQE